MRVVADGDEVTAGQHDRRPLEMTDDGRRGERQSKLEACSLGRLRRSGENDESPSRSRSREQGSSDDTDVGCENEIFRLALLRLRGRGVRLADGVSVALLPQNLQHRPDAQGPDADPAEHQRRCSDARPRFGLARRRFYGSGAFLCHDLFSQRENALFENRVIPRTRFSGEVPLVSVGGIRLVAEPFVGASEVVEQDGLGEKGISVFEQLHGALKIASLVMRRALLE